jgi:hypothetical protein
MVNTLANCLKFSLIDPYPKIWPITSPDITLAPFPFSALDAIRSGGLTFTSIKGNKAFIYDNERFDYTRE